MSNLADSIIDFLAGHGFRCTIRKCGRLDVIYAERLSGDEDWRILPVNMEAVTAEEALRQAEDLAGCMAGLLSDDGRPAIMIAEDRWNRQREMMQARLLAHLGVFTQIYARNCTVRRIDKDTAANFLNACHSYGDAACRYRYGMFLERHTGHNALSTASRTAHIGPGTLIAVAEFSNARKWIKGDKVIRSYEWTRYASLPGVRVNGGMGKMLKTFIREVEPDDIMSYADLEWSQGDVYTGLGFILEGRKEAVLFNITESWERIPAKAGDEPRGSRFFCNSGSGKYRLKLTEYE